MDLSLWDPPVCEDESFEFGGNIAENWSRSDFYYGYGLWDVIEEDALNEKACREVLRRKAIEENEEEIAMLRRRLALADDVALKEKIDSVILLNRGLKNGEPHAENDLNFQNAGKLGVISRDLLGGSPNTDSQNLGRATEKLTPTQSEEETNQNNFMARSCETDIAEELVGPTITMKEEDKAIEETFEDDAHNGGEIGMRVEPVQDTGVIEKEPHESILSLDSEVPSLTEKEEFAVGSLVAPEPSLAMEMEHVLPLLKHLKRRLPSGQAGKNKNSNYKKNNKGTDVKKDEKSNPASDVNLDPVSQTPAKKRKCQSSPLLKKNMEMMNQGILKMDENTPSQLIKDAKSVENICSAAFIELPSSTVSSPYHSLSLNRLREIAKERKLRGVSKAKKSDLIQALQDQENKLSQASSLQV